VKGERLPSLAKIASAARFSQVRVTRYGKRETIAVHSFTCLWYSVTGAKPVTVILIRDKPKTSSDLALVTTEKAPDIARVIERYAARWAIESFELTVCSPEWLAVRCRSGEPVSGLHHVIVGWDTYDERRLQDWVEARVRAVEAATWDGIASRLRYETRITNDFADPVHNSR
jgi:hypothetical protein